MPLSNQKEQFLHRMHCSCALCVPFDLLSRKPLHLPLHLPGQEGVIQGRGRDRSGPNVFASACYLPLEISEPQSHSVLGRAHGGWESAPLLSQRLTPSQLLSLPPRSLVQ